MRKTNVCAPLVAYVSTIRRNPTYFLVGLVLENCASYARWLVLQKSTNLSPLSLRIPMPWLPKTFSSVVLSAPTLALRSPMTTGGPVVCGVQEVIKIILRIYRRLFGRGVVLYKCYVPDLTSESSGDQTFWYRFPRNQAAVCSWCHQESNTCCLIGTFLFSGVKEYRVARGRLTVPLPSHLASLTPKISRL